MMSTNDTMNGPVFLSGATGFVGRHILAELLRRGRQVHALVRVPAELPPHAGVHAFAGNIADEASVARAMQGCVAAIHLVGIIAEKHGQTFQAVHVEGTRNVVAAAVAAGVGRYVHMSALGTRPGAASRYHQTKYAAEEIVRGSRLAWTIFRPSLIVGAGGEFTEMLRDWSLAKAAPFLFMPYFGQGLFGQSNPYQIQPVHVDDVAYLFAQALQTPGSIGKAYEVGGPERFTWREFLAKASAVYRGGKPKAVMGVPAWLARCVAALHLPAPFNRDQVIMSLEPNTADVTAVEADFPQLQLRGFAAGFLAQ